MSQFSSDLRRRHGFVLVLLLAVLPATAQDRIPTAPNRTLYVPSAAVPTGRTVSFQPDFSAKREQYFTILGEVDRPGVYRSERPKVPIMELVERAGGVTPLAGPLVRIVRNRRTAIQTLLPTDGTSPGDHVTAGDIVVVVGGSNRQTPTAGLTVDAVSLQTQTSTTPKTVPVCCVGLADHPIVLPLSPEIDTVEELSRRLLQSAEFARTAQVWDPQGKQGSRNLVSGSVVHFEPSLLNRETLSRTQEFPSVHDLDSPTDAASPTAPGTVAPAIPEAAEPTTSSTSGSQFLPSDLPALPSTSTLLAVPTAIEPLPAVEPLPPVESEEPTRTAAVSSSVLVPESVPLPIAPRMFPNQPTTLVVEPASPPVESLPPVPVAPVVSTAIAAAEPVTVPVESGPAAFRRDAGIGSLTPSSESSETPRTIKSLFSSSGDVPAEVSDRAAPIALAQVSHDQVQALMDEIQAESSASAPATATVAATPVGAPWSWPLMALVVFGPLAVIGAGVTVASSRRRWSFEPKAANPFDIPPPQSTPEVQAASAPQPGVRQLIHRTVPIVEEQPSIQTAWPLHGKVVGHRNIIIHQAHDTVPQPHFVPEPAPTKATVRRERHRQLDERQLRHDLREAFHSTSETTFESTPAPAEAVDSRLSYEIDIPSPGARVSDPVRANAVSTSRTTEDPTEDFDIVQPPSHSTPRSNSPLDRALRTLAMENRR